MSSDDSTSSSVSSRVPSKLAPKKPSIKKAPTTNNLYQKGRSLTPTRQDQRYSQYRAQEDTIANGFAVAINEGWSNPVTEVGLVHIKDKRSDDGKRTHQGVCVTVICGSKSRMEQTTIRLATKRLDRRNNCIILGVPKLDESIKKHRNDMIKSFQRVHGKCPSRDEGLRRSFNKVLNGDDMQYFELTLQGVGDLTNSEWQGDKWKHDPCYLKVNRDVLGTNLSNHSFVASVEIACVDGVEDVSSEDSDGDYRYQRHLKRKLRGMGYDDESESEESEDSDG
jgi:hypothetical protein